MGGCQSCGSSVEFQIMEHGEHASGRNSASTQSVIAILQAADPNVVRAASDSFSRLSELGLLVRHSVGSDLDSVDRADQPDELLVPPSLDALFQVLGFESLHNNALMEALGLHEGQTQVIQSTEGVFVETVSADVVQGSHLYDQLYQCIYLNQYQVLHEKLCTDFHPICSVSNLPPAAVFQAFSRIPELPLFDLNMPVSEAMTRVSSALRLEHVKVLMGWAKQVVLAKQAGNLSSEELNTAQQVVDALLSSLSAQEFRVFVLEDLQAIFAAFPQSEVTERCESLRHESNALSQLDTRSAADRVTQDFSLLRLIPSEMRRPVAVTLLSQDGLRLEHLPVHFRDDRQLVRVAIGQNPEAFQFASQGLQVDVELQNEVQTQREVHALLNT